jgi:glycosyltransferase involved in cell wall biosynthesis
VAQILFVYSRESSFIAIDRELLGRRWGIRDWPQPRPLVNLPALAVAVWRSDVVFGWFASWHTFWPITLAWLFRRPSVLVIGGFDTARMPDIDYGLQQRWLMRLVSRWTMRRATRLVTNSHYSRREVEANIGIPPRGVKVVHHGVPDPFGELPGGPRERLALTVGVVERRNLDRKGLRAFVEGAALLPDVTFVVAGKWADESVDDLREIAGDNVTFTGWIEQPDLDALYRRAAAYVQPSLHEGFGMSVAEAMLAGCVPVVTDAGALPEVVGDAGVVIETPPSAAAVAQGVSQALVAGEEARGRARQRVLEHFPLEARRVGLERAVAEARRGADA